MIPLNQTEGHAIKEFIKAQAGKIKENALEIYAWVLISIAAPALSFLWLGIDKIGIATGITAFVVIQITIVVLAFRGERRK